MIESEQTRQWRDWAIQDLKRYHEALRDLEHYQASLERLQARAERLAPPLDRDRICGGSNEGTEDLLCLIADRQQEYKHRRLRALSTCQEIDARISQLEDGLYQRILRDHWMEDVNLQEIAVMEGYGYSRIRDYHNEALESYGAKLIKKDRR